MNHLLLGMAAVLGSDIVVNNFFAASADSTKKVARIVAGGAIVWAGHKYLLKGA